MEPINVEFCNYITEMGHTASALSSESLFSMPSMFHCVMGEAKKCQAEVC